MIDLTPDTAATLWRELQPAPDDTVLVGDCYFHWVEAAVTVEEVRTLDELNRHVLEALEFVTPPDVAQVDRVLHLGRQIIRHILAKMVWEGVVFETPTGFQPTEQGRQLLRTGRVVRRKEERRQFRFLHPGLSFVATCEPRTYRFRDLKESQTPPAWEFRPGVLQECIAASGDWKRQQRFPGDVVELLPFSPPVTGPSAEVDRRDRTQAATETAEPDVATESRLLVDKAQSVACAVVVPSAGPRPAPLRAYAVSAQGRLLSPRDRPLFSLYDPEAIRTVLAADSVSDAAEGAQSAWDSLARWFQVPDSQRATVRRQDSQLVIQLPLAVLEACPKLVVETLQGHCVGCLPAGSFNQLCEVRIEGAGPAAAERLAMLRAVLELGDTTEHRETRADPARLRRWVEQRLGDHPDGLRAVADTAFWMGRYPLAYELAEVEDMQDAAV